MKGKNIFPIALETVNEQILYIQSILLGLHIYIHAGDEHSQSIPLPQLLSKLRKKSFLGIKCTGTQEMKFTESLQTERWYLRI